MDKKIKVAILFGGRSGEHEVSILSATSIIKNMDKSKYELKEVFIDKKGDWFVSKSKSSISDSLNDVDIALPVLHGPYGEDGTIQGLFEMMGLPYVGAGVFAPSAGMDKSISKAVFESHDLPVVEYLVVQMVEWDKSRIRIKDQIKKIGFPNFVKPANLGSSVGISKVNTGEELEKAIENAFQYDTKILIESAVKEAREIEVSVLGNEDPKASVCGEIIPSREFYSYEAKYIDNESKIKIPAQLPSKVSQRIQELAVEVFKVLGCVGMARVDFLMEKETNKIYVNEINTIPGFTKISMYPKLWEATGLPFRALIDKLIQLGFENFNKRKKLKVDYPTKLKI